MLAFLTGMLAGAYWALQSSRVQTYATSKLADHLSEIINAEVSIGRVDISLSKRVVLEDVLFEDQKSDTLFYTKSVFAQIDSLKIGKKTIALKNLTFENSQIRINKDSSGQFNFIFIIDSLKRINTPSVKWQFLCNQFDFNDANLYYHTFEPGKTKKTQINDLFFNVSDLSSRGDSLTFQINQLTLNDGNNLNVNDLNSGFYFNRERIELTNLNLETNHSTISESLFRIDFPAEERNNLETPQLDFRFSHSKISLFDLSQLLPALRGMNQVIDCSGRILGTFDDLKGRDLVLNTGRNTSAILDFYANGISNPETMYLFLDLKQSKTTFSDLSRIKLPAKNKSRYLRFPEPFYESGILSYEGNFAGFLTDFVAYGRITSEMGNLTTDLSVVPEEEGYIAYRGKVATEDFNLGELFKISSLGEITFDGSVDGFFDRTNQSVAGAFDGEIARIDLNNYTYKNIQLDGILDNRMFDGLIIMDDPNLQFDFLGKVNFNPQVPDFDFQMDLKKALPGPLNMSKHFPASEMAFKMTADFSGNKLDNLAGSIVVENGVYKNRNGEFSLKGMELQSIAGGPVNYLTFTSDFLDVKINGNYHFQNILDAFEKSMNRYIPALSYVKKDNTPVNKFGFQIDVKNIDDLMKVFVPGFHVETPFLLYGRLDSEQSVFEMKGNIPGFRTPNMRIKNILIGNNPQNNMYLSEFSMGEIILKNGMQLHNLTVSSKITDNAVDNQITWGKPDNKNYSGSIKTLGLFSQSNNSNRLQVDIQGAPTKVYIADSLWQISPFAINIDSTAVKVGDFKFFSGNQSIGIEGEISENESKFLSIDFDSINLWNVGTYLNKDMPLGGTLKGTAGIQDFYGQRLFYSDLNITNFHFNEQIIGNISLTNQWDKNEQALQSELEIIKNNRQNLYAKGFYNPGNNEMRYQVQCDRLSIIVLETVIRKTFSNFHGDASGKLNIHGTPDRILLDGSLKGENAGLTIDYTKVSYHFSDSVYFKGDTILFDQITIQDTRNNKGTFNGTLVHRNFQEMVYDLSVRTSKLTAINTSPKDNSQFYGQVMAGGELFITGKGKQVDLTGSATTLSGTDVNISLENQSEIERYDFIRFVSPEEEDEKEEFSFSDRETGDFSLKLTIRATPEATAKLIYNSQIGDVIKAQGEGILAFGMDSENNITLSGSYTVEQGDYLFTLQNVINKRFKIEQGGTIDWSGDPYEAIIDINAVYNLKASLYDLLVNTYDNVYQSQRIPVECKILLSENLSNPSIDFEIDFPSVEDRLVDELQQFFSTPEDMNKQILSLVVLGKFYTPEYLRGTYEAQNPNLIGTTASELFSNQLSNWLSQINSNVDIGLNYRPGNQITNDEIELALSTQMFNDRVTINGNIGNNNNPNSTNNSQLAGDFEINVKLIPSGKIKFKAYNRSNNNLIYETAPYTQGVGFSFSEDYNDFNGLLKKMKALFKRKEEE